MGPGSPRTEATCPGSWSSERQSQAWDPRLLIFHPTLCLLRSAAIQRLDYTGIHFPLSTDESGKTCVVALSELNVPSANENEKLIRLHNHSLRLQLPSLLSQLPHL